MDRVDVLSPDDLGRRTALLRRFPMFEVPAGKQVDRAAILVLSVEDGTLVEFSVPDELGALILRSGV